MLAFFGFLLVFLPFFLFSSYFWYLVVSSFFLFSFYSYFFMMSYGWCYVDLVSSLDLMSVCLVSLTFWLSGLMVIANWSVNVFFNFEKGFSFLIVFLALVLLISFSVDSFFYFYVFFELSLIPTFFLILGWGYQPERLSASMYMVVYTVGASLPLLGCLFYCFWVQGHLSFLLVFNLCLGGFYGKVLFFLLVLAFLVKVPVFFVHLWLPKAHVEAPVAGSMILAGVLLKLGGYGLFRIGEKFSFYLGSNSIFYTSIILWGGVVTGFICLRQVDLKGLIAYSSIGHMGLFVAGFFSGNVWGWQGGLLMLLGHGLCSPAMFALANVNYESVGSRSMLLSKGLLSLFPFFSLFWFLVCSSNMAAPPSLNLASEVMLMVSVLGKGWFWGVFLGFLSFLSGAYSLYMYVGTQHGGAGSHYGCFLSVKIRCFFLILCHWVPLNFFVVSLVVLSDWVY